MTLGTFLILLLIGLALALTFQLAWMYWILAAAGAWVLVQLIRG
jgi:hypothetical protein